MPSACSMSRLLEAAGEQALLEAVDDHLRRRPFVQPLADGADKLAGVLQSRHRHFADDEQPVGAEQHAVGPGKPGARHVDDDIVEMRGDEIEQLGHDIRIERAHFGRTVRRRDHGKAGGVIRDHDIEQLLIEAVGTRLDFVEIEPRLEIEIIGAGAVLEIEIHEARRRAAARPVREQQQRGLDRERGDAGAAHGGKERVDFRLGRVGRGRIARHVRRCAPVRPARPASPGNPTPASGSACAPPRRRNSG